MPKNTLKLPSLIVFTIYTIYSCVFVSLYHYLSSDFVLIDSIWFDIVDLAMQWVEIFGIAVIFTFLVVNVNRCGFSASKPIYFLFGGALLYKYIAAVIALSVVYGNFDITYDYSGYVVSYLIEAGCCALLVFLCNKYTTARAAANRDLQHAAKILRTSMEEKPQLLPFRKMFDQRNPVQRAIMLAMGIYTAVRLLAFIISDIAYSMMGADFTPGDIPVMLAYWIMQIFLPCFLGYCLIIRLSNALTRKIT